MKDYLFNTFQYNDLTNKRLLQKIMLLPDKTESIRLFSHLINSQYKWMARITQDAGAKKMDWWDPTYKLEQLETEWIKSLQPWLTYINSKTDQELQTEVTYRGLDDALWAATPQDVILQLNYHSIHHRAQIQTLIRQQGIDPDFVDYIGTRYRKLS